ncbi:MAG: PH domain-containing protein [Balneolaceae bacterium]
MNTEPSTRIHKNAIKAWTINALLFGLFWFIPPAFYSGIAIAQNLGSTQVWYSGIDWILLAALFIISLTFYVLGGILLPKLRWQRWKYDVSEKEVDMLRGIIIKRRTLVPINRVQHVDTRQGPVYRKFGLSSVTISTAATTHEIPALDDDTADELRNTISQLVQKVKGDV